MKSVVSAECNILKNVTVVSHFFKSAVDKIYPAQGPNVGKGKIKFYGKNFKSFTLAEPTCRIGDAIGVAKVVDPGIMECTVENMPLVQGEE